MYMCVYIYVCMYMYSLSLIPHNNCQQFREYRRNEQKQFFWSTLGKNCRGSPGTRPKTGIRKKASISPRGAAPLRKL